MRGKRVFLERRSPLPYVDQVETHKLKGNTVSKLTDLRYRAYVYPTEENFRLVREELRRVRAEQAVARAERGAPR